MRHFLLVIRLLLLAGSTTLLSGCFSYFIPAKGYLARDEERPDRAEKVIIPQEAPSIANGYNPEHGHNGLDIIAQKGTLVVAVADGVVIQSSFEPFYGNRIEISHGPNGQGEMIKTVYLHLQERSVDKGIRVNRGQPIGIIGRTGLMAGGILHLHFEIRVAKDSDLASTSPGHPHAYWVDGPGIITCFDPGKKYHTPAVRTTYPILCD